MKIIILAGGYGTRLGNITEAIPTWVGTEFQSNCLDIPITARAAKTTGDNQTNVTVINENNIVNGTDVMFQIFFNILNFSYFIN